MTAARFIILSTLAIGGGCAGCDSLEEFDDNARNENGGIHEAWDGGSLPDGSGLFDRSDAAGGHDLSESHDVGGGGAETGSSADVAVEPDVAIHDLDPGPVCGDGVVEGNEVCDDGVTADCLGTHDGGDGACVTAGSCSDQFVFDGAACVPEQITQHVHIYVSNTCEMMVDPPELNVPRGQTVRFSWHNHSQFYAVDVWQSYIGGFTDLAPQMTWNEQFEWCFNVNPYVGYSDISSAPGCPEHRFLITCNGR